MHNYLIFITIFWMILVLFYYVKHIVTLLFCQLNPLMQTFCIGPIHLLCLFHRYNIKGNSIPNRQLTQSRQIRRNNSADFCIAPRRLPIRHEDNWIPIRWNMNRSKYSAIRDAPSNLNPIRSHWMVNV